METTATRVLATVCSGTLGLLIGSFLNVVVYRLPRGESVVHPPSHCTVCQTRLGTLENVPVASWLVLRGRCLHCKAPISPRYPLVELLTGALFAALALSLPTVASVAPLDAVVAGVLATALIDLDGLEVPPSIGWATLACGGTLVAVSVATSDPHRLGWAAIDAGAAIAACGLHIGTGRIARGDLQAAALASSAGWGFAAGWVAQGGGLAIGVVWALLALAGWLRGEGARRGMIAAAGAVSIVTIVAGAIATR